MSIFRRARFFVSWLLFEYFLGRESADQAAAKIIQGVNDHNKLFDKPHCYYCGGKKFVSKIGGTEGLFTSTHHFYECVSCGNQQRSDGSLYEYAYGELTKKRIIEDGDDYRYFVLFRSPSDLIFFVSLFAVLAFPILVVLFVFLSLPLI